MMTKEEREKWWAEKLNGVPPGGDEYKVSQHSQVDHPAHYGGKDDPYEAIKVIEAWGLGFHLGNAVKYINRAGRKHPDAFVDLCKAKWYLERHIAAMEKQKATDFEKDP